MASRDAPRHQSGPAARLLRFLSDELIPYIDSHYRTSPHRIAYSGSTSGAFCVYALLSAPWVFNAVIAASPALDQGWDCDDAIALGRMFVEHYPLPTSYRALGRAYEATGQYDRAFQAFSRALDLAIRTDSPFLTDVRADVERARQKAVQPR